MPAGGIEARIMAKTTTTRQTCRRARALAKGRPEGEAGRQAEANQGCEKSRNPSERKAKTSSAKTKAAGKNARRAAAKAKGYEGEAS